MWKGVDSRVFSPNTRRWTKTVSFRCGNFSRKIRTPAFGLKQLQILTARAKSAGHAELLTEEELFARLIRVAKLRDKTLLINSVAHEFRDVLEIFDRLNSRGIRFRWLVMRVMREAMSAAFGDARGRAMRGFHSHKPA